AASYSAKQFGTSGHTRASLQVAGRLAQGRGPGQRLAERTLWAGSTSMRPFLAILLAISVVSVACSSALGSESRNIAAAPRTAAAPTSAPAAAPTTAALAPAARDSSFGLGAAVSSTAQDAA